MHVCHKHGCAHGGVCEACNWEDRAKQAENDLMSTRHELIQVERERDDLKIRLESALASLHYPNGQ